LLEHKRAVFDHLVDRWRDLFNVSFDVLLYDLTSTYFECDPPVRGPERRSRAGSSASATPHPPQPFDGVRRHHQELSRPSSDLSVVGVQATVLAEARQARRCGAIAGGRSSRLSAGDRPRCGWLGRSGLHVAARDARDELVGRVTPHWRGTRPILLAHEEGR